MILIERLLLSRQAESAVIAIVTATMLTISHWACHAQHHVSSLASGWILCRLAMISDRTVEEAVTIGDLKHRCTDHIVLRGRATCGAAAVPAAACSHLLTNLIERSHPAASAAGHHPTAWAPVLSFHLHRAPLRGAIAGSNAFSHA